MDTYYYVNISKVCWIKNYLEDKRLISIPLEYFPSIKNKENQFIIIFSDFLPKESDLPDLIWKLIKREMKLILVLIEFPRQTDACWALINKGFSDIIIWEGLEPLFKLIDKKKKKWNNIKKILESPLVANNLVGVSTRWKDFLSEVIEASIYSRSNVIITGESGTGKELIARLIHTIDERPGKGKIIMVDCTTIVPELSGSEFFGHEKGSYTSSINSREGAFALADKGTLFLDEIGELPVSLQCELLRVIQEKTFKRIGSNTWQNTDFRLVCATNRNLKQLISEGKFREDLYYRISDIELKVPALRDHSDDIEPLAIYFLKQACQEMSIDEIFEFNPEVINYIINKDYRGNIRELRQLIRRIAMKHDGSHYITLGSIPVQDRPHNSQTENLLRIIDNWEESIKKAIISGESLMEIKNIAAYLAIKIAIEMEKGDKQKAAERLNVTLRAVQQHVKKNPVYI